MGPVEEAWGSLQSPRCSSLKSCGYLFIFGSGNLWLVGVEGWGIFQSLHGKYRKISERGNHSSTGPLPSEPLQGRDCSRIVLPELRTNQGGANHGRPSAVDP